MKVVSGNIKFLSYFILLILTGSLLLQLPWCYVEGEPVAYVDALFTSVSAVCVTGLSTVYYNKTNAKVKIIGADRAEKTWNAIGTPRMLYLIEFEDGAQMTVYEDALSDKDQTCELFTPCIIAGSRRCDNCELRYEDECPHNQ